MENQYEEPKFNKDAFNCPHCQVYAKMDFWAFNDVAHKIDISINGVISSIGNRSYHYVTENEDSTLKEICNIVNYYSKIAPTLSLCHKCKKVGIWINQKMVYPKARLTPLPNKDLPDEIKVDYEEASKIMQDSPRGACALLRLALQKLMIHLGEDKNLDKAIQGLIDKKKIDETLQKALDSVRVIGNSAVHPNELDVKDNIEIATALFKIINYIAEKILSDKKQIEEIYSLLPENAKRENRKN